MPIIFSKMIDWQPIVLSLQLALISTLVLLMIGVLIALGVFQLRSKLRVLFEVFVSLPLVLPPTVIGFYFLLVFGGNSMIGSFLQEVFDIQLVFTFSGLVLASVIYSMPFMVNPILNGLKAIPKEQIESAQSLGKNKWGVFRSVQLPLLRNSIFSACVMTFAHVVGEFGVILMIGGSVPGKTRLASIAIYEELEVLNFESAHWYALVLMFLCFMILVFTHLLNKGPNLFQRIE